ncbi:hypothetical protein CPC08DRAFT_467784 [Agrocybe pediades]|nr:hypothetical protein CPC08DRAFT_467784 [Agrocybe pediades]
MMRSSRSSSSSYTSTGTTSLPLPFPSCFCPDSALNLAPVVESLFHLSSTSRDTHLYPDFSFGQFFQEIYHVRALSFAQSQFTVSLPASPLSSPRLNAKADEFRPIPRPLSAAATHPHFPSPSNTPLRLCSV